VRSVALLIAFLAPSAAAAAAPSGATACGDCHGAAFESWRTSAHALAATNPIYQAGFRVEPRRFCVDCHTSAGARAEEGIGCASCHSAREGGSPAGGHAVALRARADLRDPAFCRDCHEFATPAFEGGEMRTTDLPMQRTYSEWLAYRASGGEGTCQSCHMPGGDHQMRGAHDVALLRRSLAVTALADGAGTRLTLASVGVGHGFPTGDLFRHLTVEVRSLADTREEAWRVVDRMGRLFETRLDGATMQAYKVETADTALVPGVPRVARLPASDGALAWRVRYHYGSERDEKRGFVSADALFATLAAGTFPASPRAARQDCYRAPDWLAFSCARSRRRRAEASPGSRARAALYSRTASR
jgi:Cytochrome c7 and related cytochrome c